jgi:hypothetical protein
MSSVNNRKFYSLRWGQRRVIVEVAKGAECSPANMVFGSKKLFGFDPNGKSNWKHSPNPIEFQFEPGNEPSRRDAQAVGLLPGLYFWFS